jgi:hypothetical protein
LDCVVRSSDDSNLSISSDDIATTNQTKPTITMKLPTFTPPSQQARNGARLVTPPSCLPVGFGKMATMHGPERESAISSWQAE